MRGLWYTWKGEKLPADAHSDTKGDYVFHPEVLGPDGIIQKALNTAMPMMPLANGTLAKKTHHLNTFKSMHWQDFIEVYGISLFHENLEYNAHQNLCQLNEIWCLATKQSVSRRDIARLKRVCQEFLQDYQEIYYQGKDNRIQACSINHHWLLHIADCIANNGPGCVFWSYPLERFCGFVKKLCRSRSNLSLSASNALLRNEQMNHLLLHDIDSFRWHPDMPDPTVYPHLAGDIKSPAMRFRLQGTCLEQLNDILENPVHPGVNFTYWKRCKITEQTTIGSTASQRRSYQNRANNFICYAFDIAGRRPGRCNFGTVQSFFETQGRQFALTRWWNGVERDLQVHQITTVGEDFEGDWQIVEIHHIICLIGRIKEVDKDTEEITWLIVGKPDLLYSVRERGLATD